MTHIQPDAILAAFIVIGLLVVLLLMVYGGIRTPRVR